MSNPRHLVLRASDEQLEVPPVFDGHSQGYRRWAAVDSSGPSVHMGFGIGQLEPGGSIDWHLHAFETSFHVLEGEVVVETVEGAFLLGEGDHGFVPLGSPQAWSNRGGAPARWAYMDAPQPRRGGKPSTFFVDPPVTTGEPRRLEVRDPRTRSFGSIDAANMDPTQQTQDKLALSASMRTALLVYSGISLKMMVDSDMGAFLSTMFMVQYEPGGYASHHDHPFEEAYLIIEGVVDAVFDGTEHRLGPGDIALAGVNCPHAFKNPADEHVRWLETQAPAPPNRHAYRFARDWDYLEERLGDS